MRRIKSAGKGYVALDGNLIDLSTFKSISKNQLGRFEEADRTIYWSISLTPKNPSANDIEKNVDGTINIVYYNEKDEKDFKADYKVIMSSVNNKTSIINWIINNIILVIVAVIAGVILIAIQLYFF